MTALPRLDLGAWLARRNYGGHLAVTCGYTQSVREMNSARLELPRVSQHAPAGLRPSVQAGPGHAWPGEDRS